MVRIENFFSQFKKFEKKKLIAKFEKTFCYGVRATLPLWFEPKHSYVVTDTGPAVTEWIYEPVGDWVG